VRSVTERSFTPEEIDTFLRFIRASLVGRANAKTAREIALTLGYSLVGKTAVATAGECRKIRAMAHAAIVHYGIPLCTDNAGYFIAASRDEAKTALARLQSVSDSLIVRHNALLNALKEIS
jgi:hypothetical protein